MDDRRPKRREEFSEAELKRELGMVAVRRGLKLPETADEVAAFEDEFEAEIVAASRNSRSYGEITRRAKELGASSVDLLPTDISEGDEIVIRMAARNGTDIDPEIEDRMKDAVAKARPKADDR